MMIRIEKLPTEFIGKGEVKGVYFKQLFRGMKACLYQANTGYDMYYEVFKLKVGYVPKTKEPYECYPKANAFGLWAWAYRDYEKAMGKFNFIENENK